MALESCIESTRSRRDLPIVLIGSPPSSGSTLLSVMLDSHPQIFCGPELDFFANPCFFDDFGQFRDYLEFYVVHGHLPRLDSLSRIRNGLAPYSFLSPKNLEYYGITLARFRHMIRESSNGSEAINRIFEASLESSRSVMVAEKSPPNIYGIEAALRCLPNAKAILIVRDPIDQIDSLMRRGFLLSRAVAVSCFETAVCAELARQQGIILLRYEDLIQKPWETLEKLQEFLGVELATYAMIHYKETSKRLQTDQSIQVVEWKNRPSDGLSKSSIGVGKSRFSIDQIQAIYQARIIGSASGLPSVMGRNLAEISMSLGYSDSWLGKLHVEREFADPKLWKAVRTKNGYIKPNWFHERFVEIPSLLLG